MPSRKFKHVGPDMPIIGFTGALGSGCSFISRLLQEHYPFAYCSLTQPIRDYIAANKLPDSPEQKQDVGNQLRKEKGLDHLVVAVLNSMEAELGRKGVAKPQGLLVDGIRNTAEAMALRQWPHFYLFAVQAEYETRKRRLRSTGIIKDDEAFASLDHRDSEELLPNGQQVKKCNYLSDVILINDEDFSRSADRRRKRHVDNIYQRYIEPILRMAKGNPYVEHYPNSQEALMTAAYVESKRSSCLKRKVGAVIASPEGEIIAAGHNDVPEGSKPCLDEPSYLWCARDVLQEKWGARMKHCPNCGKEIVLNTKCPNCGAPIGVFSKRCPKCRQDPMLETFKCACGCSVFGEFVPGKTPDAGKLLDVCRSVHAEENAILSLSRNGVRLPKGCTLYTTTFPCNLCANKIVMAGISKVVYAEPYITKEAKKILEDRTIQVIRFEGVKSSAYFRFYP